MGPYCDLLKARLVDGNLDGLAEVLSDISAEYRDGENDSCQGSFGAPNNTAVPGDAIRVRSPVPEPMQGQQQVF